MKNNWEVPIKFAYNETTKNRVKAIPGTRWDSEDRTWYAPSEALPVVEKAIGRQQVDSVVPLQVINVIKLPSVQFEGLAKHQVSSVAEAVGQLATSGRWLIGDDPGLGKAAICLRAASAFWSCEASLLIVCPASVIRTWYKEIKHWAPSLDAVDGLFDIVSDHDSSIKKLTKDYSFVIVDEVHRFKNPNSKRTKALQRIVAKVKYVLGASGTLAPNSIEDICGVSQLFWPERLGRWPLEAKYSFQFNHYFLEGRNDGTEIEPRWVWGTVKPDKEQELKDRVAAISSRHTWDEVDGNFKLEPGRIFIEKDRRTARSYIEALALTGDREARWSSVTEALSSVKSKATETWVKEHEGEKLVIFTHLIDTAERLSTALECCCITGKVPPEKRDEKIGNSSLVVATMHSCGIGTNAFASFDRGLFAELYWKSDVIEQAAGRLRRLCQPKSATIDFLIVEDTIEEKMAEVLIKKLDCLNKGGLSTSFGIDLKSSITGKSDSEVLEELFASERNLCAVGETE